jgi:hypothetical protein
MGIALSALAGCSASNGADPFAGGPAGGRSDSGGGGSGGGGGLSVGGSGAEGGSSGGTGVEECNGTDDNGNGQVDEGCTCTKNAVQQCFVGDPAKAGIGTCAWGSQTCTSNGGNEFSETAWSECTGSGMATGEVCGDQLDNDCDGVLDNGCPPPQVTPCDNPNDCANPACCLSPVCQAAGATCMPGGCDPGRIMDPLLQTCRDCTAADCQLVPTLCCGAAVCQNAPWCSAYRCTGIDASCGGKTSSCNPGDLDQDDSFGDCDEAVADPCCPCKVAVGCFGGPNTCAYGQAVKNNQCANCGPGDCALPPCMGLNGCPTNCPPGQFFNGAWCEACLPFFSSQIPACNP